MKKTVIPTKFEYIRFIYIMGILKILLITAIFTIISFSGLAAALFYTDFDEKLLENSVFIASIICLALGNLLGGFLHRRSMLSGTYFIKENKIKLYLICNLIYSIIIYLIMIMVI